MSKQAIIRLILNLLVFENFLMACVMGMLGLNGLTLSLCIGGLLVLFLQDSIIETLSPPRTK